MRCRGYLALLRHKTPLFRIQADKVRGCLSISYMDASLGRKSYLCFLGGCFVACNAADSGLALSLEVATQYLLRTV